MKWDRVWTMLKKLQYAGGQDLWRSGQDLSLEWIRKQLASEPGVLVADEVGLGKTRLAVAVAAATAASGGRVAILVPPGLTWQWRDEELQQFLAGAVRHVPELSSLQGRPRLLRTFPDLFADDVRYPVSRHDRIVFISHNFGLPHTGKAKKDHLYGLPFALKRALVGGHTVRGAASLELRGSQKAVDWLIAHGSSRLHESVGGADLGKASPAAFRDPSNRRVFANMLGELVGSFDLIIIDEAHKSRAGADVTEETAAQSRLTRLLDDLLLYPGSRTRSAKRLALTATPMELDPEQWGSILSRIGLPAARVGDLKEVAAGFAQAVRETQVGSPSEIDNLKRAASLFEKKFRPLVTRRLWRDHPAVRDFAGRSGKGGLAHPHREFVPRERTLAAMSLWERERAALSECLAAAARGSGAGFGLRTAGIRYSQALPFFAESTSEGSPQGKSLDHEASSMALRREYWRSAIARLDARLGRVHGKPEWELQWHPRVLETLDLIESLAADQRKVLVFGEFSASIRALQRALNIRHYLRRVREGRPLPLPREVGLRDGDFRKWLKDPKFGLQPRDAKQIAKLSKEWTRQYVADRAALREMCVEVFRKVAGPQQKERTENILVTWLVQQLCGEQLLWHVENSRDRQQASFHAELQLRELLDRDAAADEHSRGRVSWDRVADGQAAELETAGSRFVFRMSDFAQLMVGDTKHPTRRARQGAFNTVALHPAVLIGQADVMSEGLNLHRACRDVVLFHLDWNPGRIEQQIGRVDRQDSDWMAAYAQAAQSGARKLPTLNVHTVSIEGTYDQLRSRVVRHRSEVLKAQLFGEILSADRLAQFKPAAREAISAIAIDFRPPGTEEVLRRITTKPSAPYSFRPHPIVTKPAAKRGPQAPGQARSAPRLAR